MSVPTPTTISGLPTLTINALNTAASIDPVNDYLPLFQFLSTSTLGINRNTFLGLSSAPLGLTDSQTAQNKTLDNTNTATLKDSSFTLQNASATTKQAQFSAASITAGNTRVFTLPDYNGQLATLAGTETLTNKTLTSPTINSPTITNASYTGDAIVGYTTSNNGTVYGVSITGGAIASAALANAVNTAALQSGAVTYTKLGTDSSYAWTSYTPTWTAVSVNPSFGNATVSGYYIQIGKNVIGNVYIVFGSSTSFGSGEWALTLPVNMANFSVSTYQPVIGSAWGLRTAVSYRVGCVRINGSANKISLYDDGAGSAWSSTVPVTWVSGDILSFNFYYQAA